MPSSSGVNGERKRCRRDTEDASNRHTKKKSNAHLDDDKDKQSDLPLEGVIACLSGLAQDRKEELHQLLLSLGGRYTRELNLDKNTHLITEAAQGAKYNLAVSSDPQIMHIVTPSWLSSTMENGQRACETGHLLESIINCPNGNQIKTTNSSKSSLIPLVDKALGEVAAPSVRLLRSFLFERLQFYLVGFEGNTELKQKISRLICRGSGTIHWDMNEEISILLLCDTCDDAVQKAAKVVTSHHINSPPAVSPLWVIESYKRSMLQTPSAYPPFRAQPPKSHHYYDRTKSSKRASEGPSKTSLFASTASNLSIFRGCLFSLVRSSTPIELGPSKSNYVTNAIVEFDHKQQEHLIKTHGGQILSAKLLDALRVDAENNIGGTKRKCHIVCWGGSPPRLDINPLVSQLKRHGLCELILVTPIWVQTCVTVRKRIRPERMSSVLIPQSWSMKSVLNVKLPPERVGGKRGDNTATMTTHNRHNRRLEISLTGFQGTEKAVIIHLIRAIGGVYHGNMSSANTHLVFKKNATGLKWKKAIEWGLHVVSIQWMYHILEHGYRGIHNNELGCEKKFSLGVEP